MLLVLLVFRMLAGVLRGEIQEGINIYTTRHNIITIVG